MPLWFIVYHSESQVAQSQDQQRFCSVLRCWNPAESVQTPHKRWGWSLANPRVDPCDCDRNIYLVAVTPTYLQEAMQAFRTGCILSATVMRGVATEHTFLLLMKTIENSPAHAARIRPGEDRCEVLEDVASEEGARGQALASATRRSGATGKQDKYSPHPPLLVWHTHHQRMKEMTNDNRPTLDEVLSSHERHIIAPLAPRSKTPRKRDKWKQYFERPLQEEHIRRLWDARKRIRLNYALICLDWVVIDVDDVEKGRELWPKLPSTDMVTRTPNGVHLFYRKPEGMELGPRTKVGILGIQADIRAGVSYVVGPGSIHPTGKPYERIGGWDISKVPVFDESWIDPKVEAVETVNSWSGRMKDAMAYIGKIEAVSGQEGHNATFRAACKLAESGMIETEIFVALMEWNRTNATPPWSRQELAHKAKDGYQAIERRAAELMAAQDNCRSGACDTGGDMRRM